MITCVFEDGGKGNLRHIVLHAIVEKNGKLLLEKRGKKLLQAGKWGLPGGFLDKDENVFSGTLRELEEETGWTGKIINLFRVNSNPNRGKDRNRQDVALEFIVKPIKKISEPDNESEKVEWIPIEKIDFNKLAFDHAETIKLYFKYIKKPFKLPLIV